jgi:type I site-specific restriction endonuclease
LIISRVSSSVSPRRRKARSIATLTVDLQTGVPTDPYGLDEAVKDGFLVPPKAVSLTTDFLDRGIRYDQLSEEDKEAWDALEWDEEGTVPGAVEAPASTSGFSTPIRSIGCSST